MISVKGKEDSEQENALQKDGGEKVVGKKFLGRWRGKQGGEQREGRFYRKTVEKSLWVVGVGKEGGRWEEEREGGRGGNGGEQ